MSMAEQLAYQRKLNEWKAEQKAKEAPKPEAQADQGFKVLSKEEMGKMSMAEQLAYQRKLNEHKAKEKEELAKSQLEKSQSEQPPKLDVSQRPA